MSRDMGIWAFAAFAAVVIGVVVTQGSNFTVQALHEQRDQEMSDKLDEDLRAVVNCLGPREVSIARDPKADSWDQSRNAYLAQVAVTVPYGEAWKESPKRLSVSWADHRASSNRAFMRECVAFNHLMVDSCCRAAPEAPLPANPLCRALAACGQLQWE